MPEEAIYRFKQTVSVITVRRGGAIAARAAKGEFLPGMLSGERALLDRLPPPPRSLHHASKRARISANRGHRYAATGFLGRETVTGGAPVFSASKREAGGAEE